MAPLMSQNYTRLAELAISNCIEGGSIKLTILVDYASILLVLFFNLVKAILYCIELPV